MPDRQMSFPLDLVKRVLPETGAGLLEAGFHFLVNTALDPNAGAIIEITAFRAFKPDVFSICRLLGHDPLSPSISSAELFDDLRHDA